MMRSIAFLVALPLAIAAPLSKATGGAEVIPGKYIAVMNSETSNDIMTSSINSISRILGAAPHSTYNFGDFKGYAFDAEEHHLSAINALPEIAYIEPDTKVYASALTSESNPPYGLARVSHHSKGDYSQYIFDDTAGSGTYSYIIDTGIYIAHPDFGGRATFAANFVDKNNTDGNGHGTHVAGTTGSTTYGMAKKTNLLAVKVLDASGSGSNSGVISGIQFASNDAKNKGHVGKAVANLSVGGGFSQASNDAVAAATKAGLFMAIAAGNNGADASSYSPGSEPSACTVGATDSNDAKASFSNYGTLLDIFAPGVNVLSTWNDGKTNTISGTSMATPHITGLGAYLLALEGPRSAADLCTRIQTLSNKNLVTSPGSGSKNYLAYNGNGA